MNQDILKMKLLNKVSVDWQVIVLSNKLVACYYLEANESKFIFTEFADINIKLMSRVARKNLNCKIKVQSISSIDLLQKLSEIKFLFENRKRNFQNLNEKMIAALRFQKQIWVVKTKFEIENRRLA